MGESSEKTARRTQDSVGNVNEGRGRVPPQRGASVAPSVTRAGILLRRAIRSL